MSKARDGWNEKSTREDTNRQEKARKLPTLLPGEELTALTPEGMRCVLEKLEEFARSNPSRRGEEPGEFPQKS